MHQAWAVEGTLRTLLLQAGAAYGTQRPELNVDQSQSTLQRNLDRSALTGPKADR